MARYPLSSSPRQENQKEQRRVADRGKQGGDAEPVPEVSILALTNVNVRGVGGRPQEQDHEYDIEATAAGTKHDIAATGDRGHGGQRQEAKDGLPAARVAIFGEHDQ